MRVRGSVRRGRTRGRTGTITVPAVLAVLAVAVTAGCGTPGKAVSNATPAAAQKPARPVALTVLDGGGDLAGGGRQAIEAFVKANPDLVSSVTYQTAASADVAGKLRAQAGGGTMDISVVLGGPDVFGALDQAHLLVSQLPADARYLPDLSTVQDAPRAALQQTAGGEGVLVNYDLNGPLVAYNPSQVAAGSVPTTPDAILAWAKAHPGKFTYAQPAASGSGRAFLQALPYLLGDSDPTDPVHGWTKTWAYLQQLGKYVSSYPASSSILAQQFAAGQISVLPTIIAHDVMNRKAQTWPQTTGIALFQSQNWISDGHFAMIPKGVSPQTLYVDLKLESYMVSAPAQQIRLTSGVLTSANKDVTLTDSGPAVTAFAQQWGRPDFYPRAVTTGATHLALTPANMQQAFTLWERNVGAKVGG